KGPSLTSQVKISNVQFKNIRGTSTTYQVLSLICSPTVPCEGIQVADIDLKPITDAAKLRPSALKTAEPSLSGCLNAKVTFGGKHDGLSCDDHQVVAA
ncbi:hypothetical protein Dimus_035268, partial [Dionaea muscipula]